MPISSALAGNTTYYSSSRFDYGTFLTQEGRSDGWNVFYPYDPFTGNQLGMVSATCNEVARDASPARGMCGLPRDVASPHGPKGLKDEPHVGQPGS